MIKRIVYFGNTCLLSTRNNQLCWTKDLQENLGTTANLANKPVDDFMAGIEALHQHRQLAQHKHHLHYTEVSEPTSGTMHIEDLALVVLDNKQITLSVGLLQHLHQNNTAVLICNEKHMPASIALPFEGNHLQSKHHQAQLETKKPLLKQLWQSTVMQKIYNQAMVLNALGIEHGNMLAWHKQVRSGDSTNLEARAAVYYWQNIFRDFTSFERNPEGPPPNHYLNYGYAILRAIVARAIVSSGLHPTLGLFHKNQYNAFCLADDLMEPYRPYVDLAVLSIIKKYGLQQDLTKHIKADLFAISTADCIVKGIKHPLLLAATITTASLAKSFLAKTNLLQYPVLPFNLKP
jgi:CRISP-associated protein Cas1